MEKKQNATSVTVWKLYVAPQFKVINAWHKAVCANSQNEKFQEEDDYIMFN